MADTITSREINITYKSDGGQQARKVAEDLESVLKSIENISRNSKLSKYFKDQKGLIAQTEFAFQKYNRRASEDNSKELLKTANALKAISGGELPETLRHVEEIQRLISSREFKNIELDSMFSVESFQQAFRAIELMKKEGSDVHEIISRLSNDGSDNRLLNQTIESLQKELESYKNGDVDNQLAELERLKIKMAADRSRAEKSFEQFLNVNNIEKSGYDKYGDYTENRFQSYFDDIQNGYLSASDAMAQFKQEYAYLLEDSFKANNDTFGLEQLQLFSNQLNSVFQQVEEVSRKVNDIVSNGVITKSVENLSNNESLPENQRSLFNDLLQDEESLKNINSLIRKILDETDKVKNTSLFNDTQFKSLLNLFETIESNSTSIKNVFGDIGDGSEFSPLLKVINEIKTAVSNIKLDINMDFGSQVDERMNQKLSQSMNRQLEAYRNLFSAMKASGKTNKEMLQFYEPDDASISEIIGAYKGIIKRAEEQYGKNTYKRLIGENTYEAYIKEVKNSTDQFNRATNKKNLDSPLGDIFKETDLSGVLEQLQTIVDKLIEISAAAIDIKNSFENSLNVDSYEKEISDLTIQVKELENEILNLKINPSKDSTLTGTESVDMDKIKDSATAAAEAKERFVEANENVKASAENSVPPLQQESDLMDKISESARSAAEAKERFAEANKQLGGVTKKDKYPNAKKMTDDEFSSKTKDFIKKGNELAKKNGGTILGDNVTVEFEDGLAKVTAKIKEADGTWHSFTARIDADMNAIFSGKGGFRTITKNIDKLEDELLDYQTSSGDKLTAQEALEEAKRVRDTLGLSEEYSIKINEKGLVTIKKDLDGINDAGASLTQTFKSADDAIAHFGVKADKEFKKTEVSLKDQKKKSNTTSTPSAKDTQINNLLNQTAAIKGNLRAAIDDTSVSKKLIKDINKLDQKLKDSKITISEYKQELAKLTSGYIVDDGAVKKYLDSLDKIADRKNKDYTNKSAIKPGQTFTQEYNTALSDYNAKITELQNKIADIKSRGNIDFISEKEKAEITAIISQLDKLEQSFKSVNRLDKGIDTTEITKLRTEISKLIYDFDEMDDSLRRQFRSLDTEIANFANGGAGSLDDFRQRFQSLKKELYDGDKKSTSLWGAIKNKAFYGLASTIGTYFGLNDIIQMGKQVANTVTEINTEFVELAKVSEASISQLYDDFDSYAEIAEDVKGTIADTISATSDWSRNGYDLNEAKELSRIAQMYKNVGDGIDIDTANESLISTLKGFQLDASEAEHIVDVLNEVSNNEAISSAGLGSALQRSAASLNASNTSLEKSVALITATNTVLQDPEKAGNMWKTVSARLRGASTELEQMGEDTEGMVESTSKLRSLVKGMTGFDIMEDKDTFKDIYDIVLGIGERWSDLSDVNQASLLEALAGKNQSNALAAALQNTDILKKSYQEALQSDGSAEAEQKKFDESIQASINNFKVSIEKISNTLIDSGTLKGIIDFGTSIINFLDDIIDRFGTLQTLIGGGILAKGTYSFFKNLDQPQTIGCYGFRYTVWVYHGGEYVIMAA